MATSRFYIIDTPEESTDGIIQTREKVNVGVAYSQEAPDGTFINCTLKDHWIITDEELKEYKQLKKEHVSK